MSSEKVQNKSVGRSIKELRQQLGLTLSDFSAELEIDRQTLHRYEVGTLGCPLPLLFALLSRALAEGKKDRLASSFAKAVSVEMGMFTVAALLAALMNLEGKPAVDGRTLSRLAKRAAEILESE